MSSTVDTTVNLENCDREPIHIPGLIQPDGVLLAFDRVGALTAWSANADQIPGFTPRPETHAQDLPLPREAVQTLLECIAEMDRGDVPPISLEISLDGREADFVAHAYLQRAIAEIVWRDSSPSETAAFALKAHRAIDRLKRQRSIDQLISIAVEAVRALTGFDRAMGYRFRHDDSGDVVAESAREGLEPYLGRRYPASDIPAQARRLYTINTLRLISNVSYTPCPISAWSNEPLDMSHCILRSVSPIHIEYLRNMGVGASMSVSIVVNGKLWGMLACHHMSARRVPLAVRMACDVLAQVLAANVAAFLARDDARLVERAAHIRARLAETLLQGDDILLSIEQHLIELRDALGADAVIATQFGKVVTSGDVPAELAARIAACASTQPQVMIHWSSVDEWPQEIREQLQGWAGLLAIRFDAGIDGALLFLRREQIETVRWGGDPNEKAMTTGPLGARLTPRGSFQEWREIVRDKSEPWSETYLLIARQFLADMQRATNAWHGENERARRQLLAMLGHDLRDPLQSITMAAAGLDRNAPAQQVAQRIRSSSGRMQRLISHVLDVSRIESGVGLSLAPIEFDLVRAAQDLADEARTGHPGTDYVLQAPDTLPVKLDRDRMFQVLNNLLSNARHHGKPGRPVLIQLRSSGDRVVIRVLNVGDPIDAEQRATLFNAFKNKNVRNPRNPTGMGLGLHISQEIAKRHGGQISYAFEDPHVVFTVDLPREIS